MEEAEDVEVTPWLRARDVPWFSSKLRAWLYIVSVVMFYGGIVGTLVAANAAADALAVFFFGSVVISTFPPGAFAWDRSGWDGWLRNVAAMVRFQTWLQLGFGLAKAVRTVRTGTASG